MSGYAFGADPPTTYENFTNTTDTYWTFAGNRAGGQNYGWSNTDNTGTSISPLGGPSATGAGELGGVMARSATANYYGFDIGTVNPVTDSFTARGVVRTMQRGGSSGFNLGFFGQGTGTDPIGSFGTAGNASNFIGLNFDDGIAVQAIAFDVFGGRDRTGTFYTLHDPAGDVPGPAVPFTMTWSPPPAGAGHEKGQLDVNVGGTTLSWVYTGDDNFVDFTRFGILGVSTSGGTCESYLDDLTFSSYNVAQPPPPSTPEWKINNSGDWLLGTNWTGNVSPNAIGAEAKLGSIITSGQLVYANSNVTLGKLTFDNTNSYLVAGLGTMTLQVSTGSALVSVLQGSHKLNLPIVVASNTNLNVAAGATLRVSDPVTVNSGANVVQTGAGTVLYESTVTVLGGGSLAFGNSNHVAALSVASGGMASITVGNNKALRADSLSVSGKLDLKDNRLITPASIGTVSGGTYSGVTGLIQSGRNGGSWNGNGIITSSASGNLTTLGVATAAQAKGVGAGATAVWNGQTVTGSDTLVMYTYGGDANLDGKINVDDYGRIDSSAPLGIAGWYNGDFNYDGKINVDDYGIIDFNIGIQGSPLGNSLGAMSGLSAVPEPASIAGIALIGAAAASIRRRRR